MPTRTYAARSALELLTGVDQYEGTTRETGVTFDVLDGPFAMFAALRVPAQRLGVVPDDGPEQNWLLASDGSWACHMATADGTPVVTQAGEMRLWDMLESAHAQWEKLGKPPREGFGLTVVGGRQFMWLGSPQSKHTWEV
jgi:hypothetical protein